MTSVKAVFPKSVLSWTDRIDQVDVVWANDVNSLASEIISIEDTLGAMPQVEKSPFLGTAVTYADVDARISDTMAGTLHPYAELNSSNFYCHNTDRWGASGYGHLNSYNKVYDSGGLYNGSDITVPCSGLWLITGQQTWEWHTSGYCFHHLYCGGTWRCGHRWDWDFASNGPGYYEPDRQLTTAFTFLGPLTAGTRVQSVSENGTSRNPYQVFNSYLRIYCLRTLPASALGT